MNALKRLLDNRKAQVGVGLLGLFLFISFVGPLLTEDPLEMFAVPLEPPSAAHWLGTTGQGQDVLAQTICGARTSLTIGFVVGFLVVAMGALIGTAAGFLGGRADDLLTLLINIFLIMPGLPLMVVIAAYLEPGPITIGFVLTLTGWAWSARVVRAQTLSLREKDFVAAARVSGESSTRIILFEILPNMTSLLLSSFIGAVVYAIGAQVGLEFLGLGDVGTVTWGTNLYWASNDAALLTGSWWTFVPTGVCLALVGFALAMLNNAIDEVTNPRLRAQPAFERRVGSASAGLGTPTPVLRGASRG